MMWGDPEVSVCVLQEKAVKVKLVDYNPLSHNGSQHVMEHSFSHESSVCLLILDSRQPYSCQW